ANAEIGCELGRRKAAARRDELPDLAAEVVREEVGVVVGCRPDSVRHEGAGRNRSAAGAVVVGVNWVRHSGGGRTTVGRGIRGAEALANVPPEIGTRLSNVDLFPRVLPDVVDVEAGARRIRIECDPERISKPPRKCLLADVSRSRHPREVAPST